MSCSLVFNGNSAFCFQQFHRFQTKALQPQLAHATRFVARSSPLTKTNKKHPSDDECSLLATKLPKLELYNIANNLKNLLSQDFINDLKIQIEYLKAA